MISIDLTTLLSITGVVLCLLVIGVVLRRRGFREQTVQLLVAYSVILCLLELMRALFYLEWLPFLTPALSRQILLYGALVLAWLFLHLSRFFLLLKGAGWGWWGSGVIWIAGLIGVENGLVPLPEPLVDIQRRLLPGQDPVFSLLLLGWALFAGGALVLTVIAYFRMHQPMHRNRIVYWLLASILTIAGAVLLFVFPDARLEPLSRGLYLVGITGAAYAVLIHRLFDIRYAVRRIVAYLVSTLLMIALYTGFFLAAHYLFRTIPGYNPFVLGIALALVTAILFDPLVRLIRRVMNQLIAGAVRDPSSTLREYSASISNILELEHLAATVTGIIEETVGVRHSALFVVHREEKATQEEDGLFKLRRLGVEQEQGPILFSLPFNSPVANYLRRERSPLSQYDIDLHPRFQDTASEERDWFSNLDVDVYLPIYAKDEWIGLLALGPKRSGDRYHHDDLVLLSTLADQTAVALQNARLFDDLKAQHVEIERLNENLAMANRELAEMSRAKSDFIDIASHELRTPLTQVRGYSDLLNDMIQEDTLTPREGWTMTQGLKRAAERLEEIVNTMFDVAQLDTETMHLNLMREPVSTIIDGAVRNWMMPLEERNLAIKIEGIEDLPPITADSKRLKQAFSHLIQNAIKYTPDGGKIRIIGRMLEWTLPQDQAVEIIVADTGIGIDPQDLERIFEKFYRVGDVLLHSTSKTKFKGAGPGLGLTVARGIVLAHGGRIWAESEGCDEEKCPGCEFHVVLPVQPRPPKPDSRRTHGTTTTDAAG
jgi:signal transduction histidine kinase